MTKKSINFEKQIARIHKLLEDDNVLVKWNDKIPDPDNPKQKRQIDITINRANHKTMVECRIHSKPQDSKWVEELIGRKISLEYDSLIGVSSSGFTKNAIIKAKKHGIFLRDLKSLSEDEIKSWGCSSKVRAHFNKYQNITINYVFSNPVSENILNENKEAFKTFKNNLLFEINQFLSNRELSNQSLSNQTYLKFNLFVIPPKWEINGKNIEFIIINFDVIEYLKELDIPSIKAYDSPNTSNLKRTVKILPTEKNEVEIIKNQNTALITIDCSDVKQDENLQISSVFIDLGEIMQVKPSMIGEMNLNTNVHTIQNIWTTSCHHILTEKPVINGINIDNLVDYHYIVIADYPQILNKREIEKNVNLLNNKIALEPAENVDLQITLSILLICNKDFNGAIKILQKIFTNTKSLTAKILLKVIEAYDLDVIINLDRFSFGFFIIWEQNPCDKNCFVVDVLIDSVKYRLPEYNQLRFPSKIFNNFQMCASYFY